MKKIISWQYCKDPNKINEAIKTNDENWGLESADDIISITWDTNHFCYVVFYIPKWGKNYENDN